LPNGAEDGLSCLGKGLPTELISRYRFDQGTPIEPTVRVKQGTSLGDKIWIPEIKWAIEITEIRIAEILEDSERITHWSSWRRRAAAIAAMLSGISA
jgi:hypothetical protein